MKNKICFISIFWLICQSALADFKGHENGVKSIAISNNLLVSASKDQTIKVWDINTETEIRTCYGHDNEVTSVSFSPDGNQAISGDLDGIIILWDIKDCQVIHKFSNTTKVKSVSWSPNGLYVLSAHDNGMIKLWDIKAKQELRSFSGHTDQVSDVSFSSDSSKVLSASKDTTIKLWDVETGKEIRTFAGHTKWVVSAAFSKDGLFAVSSSKDNTIRRWNIETGEHTIISDQIWASDVSFVQDNDHAISGGKDQVLKVWDLKTGQSICELTGHKGTITSVAVSKDNKIIFSASLDKTIKQWQMCELPKKSLGKAIIIAAGGAQRSNTLFPYSNEYAQRLYNIVKKRGLTDSDVYYMNPKAPDLNDDGQSDHDLQDYNLFDPETDIKDAFAQAAQNLKAGQQFILYVHGHARKDNINITPAYELSALELNSLLDTLPKGIQQVIILDTCYSGSFMDELKGVENRIVITSTDANSLTWQVSYASFADKLLRRLEKGDSFGQSFQQAERTILDDPLIFQGQRPWLDDNSDGQYLNDGQLAEKVFLVQPGIHAALPAKLEVHPIISLENDVAATIWVKVNSKSENGIAKVRAVLIKPNFVNTEYQGLKTDFGREEIELIYNAAQDRYEILYDRFWTKGIWNIKYQALDKDGIWSEIKTGEVQQVTDTLADTKIDIALNKNSYRLSDDINWSVSVNAQNQTLDTYLAIISPTSVISAINANGEFNQQIQLYQQLELTGQQSLFINTQLPENSPLGDYMACGVLTGANDPIKLDGSNWKGFNCTSFKVR
jgi:WD40 repeat protein